MNLEDRKKLLEEWRKAIDEAEQAIHLKSAAEARAAVARLEGIARSTQFALSEDGLHVERVFKSPAQKVYVTTHGVVEFDDPANCIEYVPDPMLPDSEHSWRLVSSVALALRNAQQGIVWVWERDP